MALSHDDARTRMRFLGLGTEFAAAVAGLSLFGWWLGGRFGGRGDVWGLLIGFALGFAGGMYNLIRTVRGNRGSGSGEGGPTESGSTGSDSTDDSKDRGPER